jgi:hypothetical protein
MFHFLHSGGERIYYTFVVVSVGTDYLFERTPKFSAILTKSATDSAHIFASHARHET